MNYDDVYIVGGLRSHLGLKNGIFKNVPPEKLGAALLQQLFHRFPQARETELIIGGNATGPGGNVTRLAALLAGIAEEVPALTLDMQCASALEAILLAYAQIRAGLKDVIIAGGVESASMQPKKIYQPWDERYEKTGFYTAQFSPDTNSPRAMLEGAERTAQVYGVSRKELDNWAVRSHQNALQAQKQHWLEPIIAPLFDSTRDESIRPRMNKRLAARMPALFTAKETEALLTPAEREKIASLLPTLTAANACLTQDGAAYLLLCSGKKLASWQAAGLNVQPWGKILAGTEIGISPRFSPLGALAAGEKLLQQTKFAPEQIDDFEYNEAFAVISALFARKYPHCVKNYLPLGGALAYGHPYGCSGAVLVLHALCALQARKGRLALCAIAGAGGTGSSLLLERKEF